MTPLEQFCQLLNDLIQIDPDTIQALVTHRVLANQWIVQHPQVQVGTDHKVGMIGILNGLAGPDDAKLAICYDPKMVIQYFVMLDPGEKTVRPPGMKAEEPPCV